MTNDATLAEQPIEVIWQGGRRYRGGPAGGATLALDGDRETAPTPVDAVLVALAACSAIDVVEVLEKRRTPPTDVRVRVEFERAPAAPRRITAARLRFTVAAASDRAHVERAVELSFDKYCSVAHTLAPDLALSWDVELMSDQ